MRIVLYFKCKFDDLILETFKTLTVRLCAEGEHAVIGKIKFLWPEQCLPNE
ncbi:hypothetical protein WUBG_17606, partial [Wuchereria bancrofti]